MEVTQQHRHDAANRLQNSPVGLLDTAAPLLVLRGYCPMCSEAVHELRDEGSLREFGISGLCQTCQDSVFGIDGEGPMETAVDPSTFS